ncbi:transposase, MuDR, MULE transposase domain protein [Tanacetum coccineum]
MEDTVDIDVQDSPSPRWENILQSPILENVSSKYKLKLKYGGYFRLAKNSSRKRYCLGFQKCIYMDTYTYNFSDLVEEVMNRYPSKIDQVLSIMFVDKYATEQSFIELDSDENFQVMLNMYEKENEVTIYVTTNKEIVTNERQKRGHNEDIYQPQGDDDDSDGCPSEGSYHSYIGSDNEDEIMNYERETISDNKNIPTIEVNSRFSNAVVFKRALNHYALMNEFEYFIEKSEPTRFTARCAQLTCRWRIHAAILQDGVTFKLRNLKPKAPFGSRILQDSGGIGI